MVKKYTNNNLKSKDGFYQEGYNDYDEMIKKLENKLKSIDISSEENKEISHKLHIKLNELHKKDKNFDKQHKKFANDVYKIIDEVTENVKKENNDTYTLQSELIRSFMILVASDNTVDFFKKLIEDNDFNSKIYIFNRLHESKVKNKSIAKNIALMIAFLIVEFCNLFYKIDRNEKDRIRHLNEMDKIKKEISHHIEVVEYLLDEYIPNNPLILSVEERETLETLRIPTSNSLKTIKTIVLQGCSNYKEMLKDAYKMPARMNFFSGISIEKKYENRRDLTEYYQKHFLRIAEIYNLPKEEFERNELLNVLKKFVKKTHFTS